MNRRYIPNAWLSRGTTHHVAQRHPKASDDNPGTGQLPFKTISAAAAVASLFDKIVIDEGVYREQVPIARHGHIYYPQSLIAFEAVRGKEVYVKGSDLFDADWKDIGGGIHAADLPRSLFEGGAYNPYAWACHTRPSAHRESRGVYPPSTFDGELERVRPTQEHGLPETLGQIYVDGEPFAQLDSVEAVRACPGSFVVPGDGRQIVCHFRGGKIPRETPVELTMRERCFKPTFPVPSAGLMITTAGICAEHAANPGAFSYCRPLAIRPNLKTGITVRKTLHMRNNTGELCGVMWGNPSYLGGDDPSILCHVHDGTRMELAEHEGIVTPLPKTATIGMVSRDGAETWQHLEDGPLTEHRAYYFLDQENGMLLRHYPGEVHRDSTGAPDAAGMAEQRFQVSADAGRTWSCPEKLAQGKNLLCYTMLKLQNGQLFLITSQNRPERSPDFAHSRNAFFFVAETWLGTWRRDHGGIDWEAAGTFSVDPEMSQQGVDEPQCCQLPDGRIFAIVRQCGTLASQDSPGCPTGKLYAVSEDNGRTWREPRLLTFDDGAYLYSSVSFASTFCSSKNGRVYVILNMLNRPFAGCLPRVALHIAEIDTTTFTVKRDTVTVVEEVHEEHSYLVGYSNWNQFENRDTKNLLLFMKLENGPVYEGYDFSAYRYEIEFPA